MSPDENSWWLRRMSSRAPKGEWSGRRSGIASAVLDRPIESGNGQVSDGDMENLNYSLSTGDVIVVSEHQPELISQ